MRLELEELESFKVGESVSEKVARDEARKSNRHVLSCRWVSGQDWFEISPLWVERPWLKGL